MFTSKREKQESEYRSFLRKMRKESDLSEAYCRASKIKKPRNFDKRLAKYEKIVHTEKVLQRRRFRQSSGIVDYQRPLCKAAPIKKIKVTAGLRNMLHQLMP